MKMPHTLRARRRAVLGLAGLLTVAVGLLWAHEGHAPLPTTGIQVDREKGQVVVTAEARQALDVRTAEVGTDAPPATALAYARLVAPWQKHAFASSRLGGRISALHARPGETVRAGAILAEVQSPELDQLRLAVTTARTDVRQAEQVFAGLKGSAVVTGQQVLDAENQLRQSQIARDVAATKWLVLGLPEEQLDQAATATPALPIRAPVGGTVIHADLAIGKVVEAGEHLFEIVDHSTVWARIGVLEIDLPRVAAGQAVELHLTAYPGRPLRGKVNVVEAALDPVTLLTTAWAEFPNPAGAEPRLLPGMSGQARIELPAPKGTKTVPTDALVSNGVDRFVLVETANTAERSEYQKKSVTVVREAGGVVVIRSADLFAGDRVVTRGSHELGGLFEPEHVRFTPETRATIGLAVDTVGMRTIDDIVELPGTVELPPDGRTVAASPLAGMLASLRAEPGQRVAVGDVLGDVFSLEFLTLQLDYLREALAADLAAEQLRQLRGAEGVGRRRVVDAEAAAAASGARRDSLRRRLGVLGLSPDQLDGLVTKRRVIQALPVRANLAGTLVAFGKVLGQSIRADEALFEVHDRSRPWVRGAVSERDVSHVKIGQSARVRPAGDPTRTLLGKVVRSGRTFDPADRALSVWVELNDPADAGLRHGQRTRIALSVATRPPALAVPLGAVARDGTRAYVFVRQPDGTFDRRAVRLGRSDDRHAEVLDGLSAGESIAVSGAADLATAYASVH